VPPDPTTPPDLYATLDYRQWLGQWFDARKAANPRFSHRVFARMAGQRSPSLLMHVIQGKRNLTPATVAAFAKALRLDRADAAHFRALVDLAQAETDADRNAAFEKISATRRFREAFRVEGEGFRYLSNWTIPAVRELALRPDFEDDPAWVARTLRPRVTRTRAQEALNTLHELGMLAQDEAGRWHPTDASVVTPTEVLGLAVHNYHREMIDRSRESIDGFEPEERHLLGVTVAVPESMVDQLKDELNRFQARLLDLCDGADAPADRVYQLNLHLFPLSAGREEDA
jgi:uncharacterized protein (TIGR02147 family)